MKTDEARPIRPKEAVQGEVEYVKPAVSASVTDDNEVGLTIDDHANWTKKPKSITCWLDPLDAVVLGEQLALAGRAAFEPKKRREG